MWLFFFLEIKDKCKIILIFKFFSPIILMENLSQRCLILEKDLQQLTFQKGLHDGIPICLGYLSVSFAFGLMVTENGLPVWIAVLISMTNLTSAGQFAGLDLILAGGLFIEIAITTFIINIRYMLMSLSLSQRVSEDMTLWQRLILSFGVTDETFAIAMQQGKTVTAGYFAGLILLPYFGWALGTFLGAAATGILPLAVRNALGIAIYGMFIAIIIPEGRKSHPVALAIIFSAFMSCIFTYAPGLEKLSGGWVIIICAVVTSALAAKFFPIDTDNNEESEAL